MKKKTKNKTPPILVLSQTTFPFIPYVLQSGVRVYVLVRACIRRCQKAESAMQMSPINTSLTALICIYAAFKNTHLMCTYCTPPCVCRSPLCCEVAVHWNGVLTVWLWYLVLWETRVYPGRNTIKNKEKQTKWTWEACQYQTGDQSSNNEISSPTVYYCTLID